MTAERTPAADAPPTDHAAPDEMLGRHAAGSAGGTVFLLLEACGYEGDFVLGVFSSRELAEEERIKECIRDKRDPKTFRSYYVREFAIDVTVRPDV